MRSISIPRRKNQNCAKGDGVRFVWIGRSGERIPADREANYSAADRAGNFEVCTFPWGLP